MKIDEIKLEAIKEALKEDRIKLKDLPVTIQDQIQENNEEEE